MSRDIDDLVQLVLFGREEVRRELVAVAHEIHTYADVLAAADIEGLKAKQRVLSKLYDDSEDPRDYVESFIKTPTLPTGAIHV